MGVFFVKYTNILYFEIDKNYMVSNIPSLGWFLDGSFEEHQFDDRKHKIPKYYKKVYREDDYLHLVYYLNLKALDKVNIQVLKQALLNNNKREDDIYATGLIWLIEQQLIDYRWQIKLDKALNAK